ncbi:hypothetical protein K505DRAFT_296009 [Melanomma pulvis-pyrius CBS 109.77]|uniref:Zn(2)-C6 fungal-type domain-containing protein n=1 Tax=Melanomma pulvis-pyrius CBS 109.77 TaxID=1314802 RepID=A0A6A6XQA6_9PLEO|nr:hypothetical protein K505DRAFT_296009 [Melanomma pulvis-pyrius CBS 109.77]
MRTKQKNVCHTCRAHKIGCDGKRPSCSQCSLTGRHCEGYQLGMVFVSYPSNAPSGISRRTPGAGCSTALQSNTSPTVRKNNRSMVNICPLHLRRCSISRPVGLATSEEYTAVILRCFVPRDKQRLSSHDWSTSQVCGAWVDILPRLVDRARSEKLVSSAVRAFGSAILDRNSLGENKNFRSLEAYNSTLQQLRVALALPKPFFGIEEAAAIICLAMVELILPTSDDSVHKHFRGLDALIQSYPPEPFSSDMLHALFVGCRPVLLFQSLYERRSTFLAQEKWVTTPFREHPPSAMQILLSDVAILPSILEESDLLQSFPHNITLSRSYKIKARLSQVLSRLLQWEDRRERDTIGPIYSFQQMQDVASSQPTTSSFRFPSLMAANVHIHLWAFRIICLNEMEKVDLCLYDNDRTGFVIDNVQKSKTETSKLAIKIFQSIEYLLQDEMKLYGPASALFPLKIAYDTLSRYLEENQEHIKHFWKLVACIRRKGFSDKFHFPQRAEFESHLRNTI